MSGFDRTVRAAGLAVLAMTMQAASLAGQESLYGRPSLGVVVDMRAGASDSIGARIESVTPGGPADRAGVRSGDIITRIGGSPLVRNPNVGRGDGARQSQPALRLIAYSARLAPNDTVALQLRRGKSVRNVRVITEPLRTVTYWRSPAPGNVEGPVVELQRRLEEAQGLRERLEEAQGQRALMTTHALPFYTYLASPLASLQLAPLNAELGEYFGIGEGILVISVPERSGLRLRGGDVILRVDGRTPASPSHLLRILQSYSMDEDVRLDIVRNRKRETVEGTLSANR